MHLRTTIAVIVVLFAALATGRDYYKQGALQSLQSVADRYHFVADFLVVAVLLAAQSDSHMWRLFLMGVGYCAYFAMRKVVPDACPFFFPIICWAMWMVPLMRPRQSRRGWVFVTGGDSGMGKETAAYLASLPYDGVFSGCFNVAEATKALRECCKDDATFKKIVPVALDVTSDASVKAAAATVEAHLKKVGGDAALTALVNFHGLAFNGPVEYMPIELYQRQMEVNFIGNIRMTQSFLPLLKRSVDILSKVGIKKRARLVFTGTGGGACSPCPALLSAYMSSKFACEAYCQSLRMEMQLQGHPIDCCMINPGFVKPTMLIEVGQRLADNMWTRCKEQQGSDIAKKEYGPLFDHFNKYSALQPGTHVSFVAKAADDALTAYRPWTSYKVGPDSKAAPIVGMLPTGLREWIARNGMFGVLSPAGKVKGYNV